MVAEAFERPVTAAQIRATREWQATYPGVEVVYEQQADEGEGAGFDNLDLGAHAWTYYHAAATWEEIVDAYRAQLMAFGWHRTDAGGSYWTDQRWGSNDHPGRSIALTHRPPQPWEAWSYDPSLGTVFSVMYRVDPAPLEESAIDHA
jgi:hypothetical protein